MDNLRPPEERRLVRAEAETILQQDVRQSWQRNYRQMARGTLAALDWVEGRRALTPSSGEPLRPDDVLELSFGRRPTALNHEISMTEDWGSGYVRPPNEDMHYHGAVWALLRWSRSTDGRVGLSISVPGLDV